MELIQEVLMKHKKVKNSKFLNKILTYTKANDKKIKILLNIQSTEVLQCLIIPNLKTK